MIDSLLCSYLRTRHRGQAHVLRVLRRTGLPKSLPLTTKTGLQLSAEWTDWAGLYLLRHRCLEPLTSELIVRLLEPGDTVVDVGAHVGYMSLIAAQRVGPTGRVVSVEPQPRNCQKLLEAASANQLENITLFCGAAGAQHGSIKLLPQPEHDHSALSLLTDLSTGVFGFVVPVLTLNAILEEAECQKLRLIKIDVEGYEREVACGFDWTGPLRPNYVIAEALTHSELAKERSREFIQFMVGQGYSVTDVLGNAYDPNRELPEDNLLLSSN